MRPASAPWPVRGDGGPWSLRRSPIAHRRAVAGPAAGAGGRGRAAGRRAGRRAGHHRSRTGPARAARTNSPEPGAGPPARGRAGSRCGLPASRRPRPPPAPGDRDGRASTTGAAPPGPTVRRAPATVSALASRRAGSAIDATAIVRPTSAEPAAQSAAAVVLAPKLALPNATAPIARAAPSPITVPAIPASADSARAIRTSCAVVAPRARSSAWSRRRRSEPAGCDRRRHQPREDRAGEAEKAEQQLGVERVLARLARVPWRDCRRRGPRRRAAPRGCGPVRIPGHRRLRGLRESAARSRPACAWTRIRSGRADRSGPSTF